MKKMRRAPNPAWLSSQDKNRLYDFALKYGGTFRIHNHKKTIGRW